MRSDLPMMDGLQADMDHEGELNNRILSHPDQRGSANAPGAYYYLGIVVDG